MRQKLPPKLLRLCEIESADSCVPCVGNVVQTIGGYLGWDFREFSFGGCGPLTQRTLATIKHEENDLTVEWRGGSYYLVYGFPEDKSFEDFREQSGELYRAFMKNGKT